MSSFKSFDGLEIDFEILGDGPPAVLLHGFAADRNLNWIRPGIAGLLVQAGRAVILPDARGHGRSGRPHDPRAYAEGAMATDVRRLFDHLVLDQVDLIGYSMGALTALQVAEADSRVVSLVLGGIGGAAASRSSMDRHAIADALMAEDVQGVESDAAKGFRQFAESTGADLQALAAIQRAPRAPIPASLDKVTMPTLVICGADDKLAGSPLPLAERLPNAKAIVVAGDHLSAVRDPEFTQAIIGFVESVR